MITPLLPFPRGAGPVSTVCVSPPGRPEIQRQNEQHPVHCIRSRDEGMPRAPLHFLWLELPQEGQGCRCRQDDPEKFSGCTHSPTRALVSPTATPVCSSGLAAWPGPHAWALWSHDSLVTCSCTPTCLTLTSVLSYSSIGRVHHAPGEPYCGQYYPVLVPARPAQRCDPGLRAAVL